MLNRVFQKLKELLGLSKVTGLIQETDVPRDDYSYNELRAKKAKQLDEILEKINKKGMESLTKAEKAFLDKESTKL